MKLITFVGFGLLLFVTSCSSNIDELKSQAVTIQIDLDSIVPLNVGCLSQDTVVVFESIEDAFLVDIRALYLVNDTIVVYSRDKVATFDMNGKYIGQIGQKGHAGNEYVNLFDMYIDNDHVFIFDNAQNKLLEYDLSGRFVKAYISDSKLALQAVRPLGDEYFIGKPSYRGGATTTPEFVLCTSNLGALDDKCTTLLNTPMKGGSEFFAYHPDSLLYWQMLCDTVFSVGRDLNKQPKYIIDFGSKAITTAVRNKYPEIMDLIMYTNQNTNFASMVQCVVSNDSYLGFEFLYDKNKYFALVDKGNNFKTTVFDVSLTDRNLKSAFFLSMYNNQFIQIATDPDKVNSNYTIVFFDIKNY